MNNKMKMMLIGLMVLGVNSQAQKMKVWKSGVATEYDVATDVDSVTFENASGIYGSMTDSRDAKVYKTIVIGTQTWMAENLNHGSYLPGVASGSKYQSGSQKFCYANRGSNCDTYGGLYQWHAAMSFAEECSDGTK